MSSSRKRAAIQKANREADHLRQKLMLAEHQNSVLQAAAQFIAQRHDAAYAALRELVALKKLKDSIDQSESSAEHDYRSKEYMRRKPVAWKTAFEVVQNSA